MSAHTQEEKKDTEKFRPAAFNCSGGDGREKRGHLYTSPSVAVVSHGARRPARCCYTHFPFHLSEPAIHCRIHVGLLLFSVSLSAPSLVHDSGLQGPQSYGMPQYYHCPGGHLPSTSKRECCWAESRGRQEELLSCMKLKPCLYFMFKEKTLTSS